MRLTENELEDLCRKVGQAGISKEAYLRSLIKDVQPKGNPSQEFFDILKNLRQINNNMNQIAAKANTMNFIDTVKYWANVSELQKAIGKLMEEMYR